VTADYWPDLYHGVAWAADPNDPIGVPVYTDHTAMVGPVDRIKYGRDYELAVTRVFDSTYTMIDPSEYVNPANSSSPYYPYVQPYRRICSKAVWPKGSSGNLLNLFNWRVPFDGSLESYTVGTTPEWITAASPSGPTITTSDPWQGTKSLTWNTSVSAIRQGIQWSIPAVPGQQYTLSAYIRQTAASTQVIRISDQVLCSTTFNRTTASGWGTDSAPLAVGGAWTGTGGASSERSTTAATEYASAYATMAVNAVNSNRWQTSSGTALDVRQRVRVQIPVVATGGEIQIGSVARWSGSGANCYEAVLIFGTDQSVTLRLGKRVATVFTALGDVVLSGVNYQAGDEFHIDWRVTANELRATAWRDGDIAQNVLDVPMLLVNDSSLTTAGSYGMFYWLHASNTNSLPVAVRCYNYSAVGAVEGSTTAATGSYQRLSVTFTATAPYHTATLVTQGTAAAGTVNADGFMLNTGAAAGTFAATGSSIYPLALNSIERFPRTYEAAGFLGICKAPAVDPLAAWAAIPLPSDYDWQVRALSPDFYWKLDGGQGATLYPDGTGNGNPPLGLNISKFGVGDLPTGGSAMDVPGGAGMTGVTFFAQTPNGNNMPGTVLGTGRLADAPQAPFVLPSNLSPAGGVWSVTVAAWVKISDTGAGQSVFYPSKQLSATAGAAYVPAYMNADGSSAFGNVGADGTIYTLSSGTGLSGIDPTDGLPHLHVTIVVQDTAGTTFIYRYIDDVLDGANSALTSALGGALRGQTDSLSVGATDDGSRFLAPVNGTVSRLAVWNRELTSGEASALYQAGAGIQETSGDRLERDVTQGGYYGETRIDTISTSAYVDGDPVAYMGAPGWTGTMDLLTRGQDLALAEQGTLWAAPDGAATFEGRQVRFLRLTPSWTLGEDEAAGEYPYLGDLEFDFDPTFVYNDVEVSRPGGGTAQGGLSTDVAAARRRFYPRGYSQSSDYADDRQVQDAADWIFYSHRAPNLRVASVTLDPAANPDLWPFVLGAMVGQRIRVKRRAKAGNAGAGLTMSADYFIESIGHIGLDPETGHWTFELTLSPVGTGPGPTVQPWILEDATFGVLDSTTTLGF
jgi:hypothetical protein